MIVILSLVLGVLAYVGHKQIRKYFVGITVLISILSIGVLFIESDLTQIITQGFIGLAFFVIVMFAGAFKKQSKVSKRLRSVRKEYSIFGFILLVPHALVYVIQFLDGSYPTEWIGIIAFVVMIPLFIISFNKIKRTMNMKTWKKVQKWAYLAYLLTFLHLVIVSEGANQISYIIIFSAYSLLKIKNYLWARRTEFKRYVPVAIVLLVIGSLVGVNSGAISFSSLNGIDYNELELVDGVYTGSASGFKNLQTELTVTVENGEITEIYMDECGCTAPHHGTDYEEAAYEMIDAIIQTQSTDLDAIAGATKTADSVLEAVEVALENQVK